MTGRPYAATITVRCAITGCECEHSIPATLYETKDKGQLLERVFEKNCSHCGHFTQSHATIRIEKGELVERRTIDREK